MTIEVTLTDGTLTPDKKSPFSDGPVLESGNDTIWSELVREETFAPLNIQVLGQQSAQFWPAGACKAAVYPASEFDRKVPPVQHGNLRIIHIDTFRIN